MEGDGWRGGGRLKMEKREKEKSRGSSRERRCRSKLRQRENWVERMVSSVDLRSSTSFALRRLPDMLTLRQ